MVCLGFNFRGKVRGNSVRARSMIKEIILYPTDKIHLYCSSKLKLTGVIHLAQMY